MSNSSIVGRPDVRRHARLRTTYPVSRLQRAHPRVLLVGAAFALAGMWATVTPIAVVAQVAPANAPLQSAQPAAFDHGAFDALLRAHVVRGMVDYDAFAASSTFPTYLAQLAAADPSGWKESEQLAFWINAYNAYTIRLITDKKERESIRNINKSFGLVKAYGPWKEKMARVGGKVYGLDEIEQDIIRVRFKEPRIHFALVCAAMGCPPLRSEAFTGARLDTQLDEQARLFLLQSPTKNRVDVPSRTVYVSPIFVEFRDYIQDFGGSNASVGKFIARYHPPGAARDLLESGNFTLRVTDYDWTLNSQTNANRGKANGARGSAQR